MDDDDPLRIRGRYVLLDLFGIDAEIVGLGITKTPCHPLA